MSKVPKIVGVYEIKNIVNGRVYIGQSTSIKQRFYKHRTMLNKQWHFIQDLQEDWNKYGRDCFQFNILEKCEDKDRLDREQYWIDYYGGVLSDKLYNVRDNDEHCVPDSVKEKISESLKGNIPWNKGLTSDVDNRIRAGFTNSPMSDEMKAQISKTVKLRHQEGRYDYKEIEKKKKETRKRNGTVRKDKGKKHKPMSEEQKRRISEGKLKANARKRELGLPLRSDSDRYKRGKIDGQ